MICWVSSFAADPASHCREDMDKINSILSGLKKTDAPAGDKIVSVAEMMTGSPEDFFYTTDSVAALRINVDSFSPLMFINSVIALVKASENPVGNSDWTLFFREFEDISCRRGENNGFPSIMYHTADWIGDNMLRGNISELTENYPGVTARTKSLDEMTRKRENYAALADSATFEAIRMTEMGFRTHRIPALKKETINKKEIIEDIHNGDIIILVSNRDGIDFYDIGFIKKEDGVPYIIHVSPQTHSVVKEKDDIIRYMKTMTKHFQGYRLLRLNN